MCGICVTVVFGNEGKERTFNLGKQTISCLENRGPDHFKIKTIKYNDVISIKFLSSVLCLRGKYMTVQPYEDEFGNMLLFNGEMFSNPLYFSNLSDTALMSQVLADCENDQDFTRFFSDMKGPHAFVYFQPNLCQLWFGRDIVGRRSLLCSSTSKSFVLSSVAVEGYNVNEIPSDGIYCMDLEASSREQHPVIVKFCHSRTLSGMGAKRMFDVSFSDFAMTKSVSPHMTVSNISNLCLTLPPENIAYHSLKEEELFARLLSQPCYLEAVRKLEVLLTQAIKIRVNSMPPSCRHCIWIPERAQKCKHTKVAILFSGGLDSMVIAALADRLINSSHPVDLLNVAFPLSSKKKQDIPEKVSSEQESFDTPDRITGKAGLQELMKLSSAKRCWNFVEIDVPLAELEQARNEKIGPLLFPSCTVLDDSIGCALWFAARGKGKIKSVELVEEYTSPARVVLVGMGADELFAGYSRHRAKFGANNWMFLLDEMTLEIDRIGSRNLGRDDRIISDHGREVRHPYLDEEIIDFANKLPIWIKADLRYPRGVGEKLLLRLLAFQLGLKKTAFLPKRAIQFGSRIARSENSSEKGSDACNRLNQLIISEDVT